jgi:hypothetical protein
MLLSLFANCKNHPQNCGDHGWIGPLKMGETEGRNFCPAGRLHCYKMEAVKILKTRHVKTTDDRAVY